jgi:hypothetical protein
MPHIHRKTDQDLTGILSGGIDEYGTNAAVIYYQAIIDKCELAASSPLQYAASRNGLSTPLIIIEFSNLDRLF